MPTETPCDPDSLQFGHPYDIIDAMMLFGAMLEPTKRGTKRVRLVLGRSMPHWPSLGWALAICWQNRLILRMKGGEMGIREKLIFSTAGERWLEHALYRWYPGYRQTGKRKAKTPADIRINEGMLICWLVNAMSRASARPRKLGDDGKPRPNPWPIILTAPRLDLDTAQSIIIQLNRLAFAWQVEIRPGEAGHYKLWIPPGRYDGLAQWLAGAVDPQFWGRPEIMS